MNLGMTDPLLDITFPYLTIENLYFREDKIKSPETNLKKIKIKKNMGWCDDIKSNKYNKLISRQNRKYGDSSITIFELLAN